MLNGDLHNPLIMPDIPKVLELIRAWHPYEVEQVQPLAPPVQLSVGGLRNGVENVHEDDGLGKFGTSCTNVPKNCKT